MSNDDSTEIWQDLLKLRARVVYELLLYQTDVGMPILNRIKEVAASKGDDTNYKFWKRSGLSQSTAYRVYRDPTEYPSAAVLNTVCEMYGVQPGDCLKYVAEEAMSNS